MKLFANQQQFHRIIGKKKKKFDKEKHRKKNVEIDRDVKKISKMSRTL